MSVRRRAAAVAATALVGAAFAAFVPVACTGGVDDASPLDAGGDRVPDVVFDVDLDADTSIGDAGDAGDASDALPEAGTPVPALYVGLCVTALAAEDPEEALRFYTETTFAPFDPSFQWDGGWDAASDAASDAGTGPFAGILTMKMTPLEGWQSGGYYTPPTVTKTYERTSAVSATAIVGADGTYTATFGTENLAAEANSISGRDAVIENLTLAGRVDATAARFCAHLSGHLTVPYDYVFVPSENTCLFVRVSEDDPMPSLMQSEFVCP